ncbi:hypothetical protein TcasGA2_TC002515 [Tribolium castaneum]|uniref:Uncharacterized protein n=1 Tax=Tribolium castaneum TaxID=7070 RepID=D6WH66_TRICA|nr:hypothetical protein TcasGA2_TC002515 [Tribolium castaneum]
MLNANSGFSRLAMMRCGLRSSGEGAICIPVGDKSRPVRVFRRLSLASAVGNFHSAASGVGIGGRRMKKGSKVP